jgi:hypothetical protein
MADDMQIKREIVLEADAETLERMRKEGHARGFTVFATKGSASAATTRRRRRWPISVCLWAFDC